MNKLKSKHYRLPTEAEWEYAAHGGKDGLGYKYSGNENPDNVAWYYDNSERRTKPVGEKSPNELGIYDMSGNVWEWCNDWLADNYYRVSPASDPKGPQSGKMRILRGGSWNNNDINCRVACRFWDKPDRRYAAYGLRLAQDREMHKRKIKGEDLNK